MASVSATDRENLSTFIHRYKSHTCLWNVSIMDYRNKQKRLAALQDLAPLLGKTATIDLVRKKIDIIRNGYFRELKKVKASISSGDEGYTPSLWYYDMMTFLSPDEMSTTGSEGTAVQVTGDPISNEIKRRKITKTEEELRQVTNNLFKTDSNDDADVIFGLYLSRQLNNVESDQRILAEKLMSDVLYLARMNKLNESSEVVTHMQCQASTFYDSYTTPQSDPNSPADTSSTLYQYITLQQSQSPPPNVKRSPS